MSKINDQLQRVVCLHCTIKRAFTSRVGPNVGLTAALDTKMSSFPNLSRVCKVMEWKLGHN